MGALFHWVRSLVMGLQEVVAAQDYTQAARCSSRPGPGLERVLVLVAVFLLQWSPARLGVLGANVGQIAPTAPENFLAEVVGFSLLERQSKLWGLRLTTPKEWQQGSVPGERS